MTTFEFTVYGSPISQGSMTKKPKFAGRDPKSRKALWDWRNAALIPSNEGDLKSWRQECTKAALQVRRAITAAAIDRDMAICVTFMFLFQRPASLPKKVVRHIRKPDFDKCLRAALDAFTAVLYFDDSQADEGHIYKRYAGGPLDPLGAEGTPRMIVRIQAQEEVQPKPAPLFEEKSTSEPPPAKAPRKKTAKPPRAEVGF